MDTVKSIVTQRETPRDAARRPTIPPSFAELIAARSNKATEDGKRRYDKLVAQFCRSYGSVDDVYWGADNVSGVAVTLKPRRWHVGYPRPRLHRVSDHATRNAPEVAGAIEDWELLAVRAEILRGPNAHLCMQWIMAGIAYLLATVVAAPEGKLSPEVTKEILARQQPAMRNANAYYLVNATRGAHIDYFGGMMLGALFNTLLAIGAFLFIRWPVHWLWGVGIDETDQAYAFGCIAAGAIGAIFSVVLRMTVGRFTTDFESGRSRLWVIGSFRPFIGAVSGLALYFAAKGGFISFHQNQDKFVVLAFLAFLSGFSERFARDTFLGAEAAVTPVAPTPPSGGATTTASTTAGPALDAKAAAQAAAAQARREAESMGAPRADGGT
jgi:hypothetical protein